MNAEDETLNSHHQLLQLDIWKLLHDFIKTETKLLQKRYNNDVNNNNNNNDTIIILVMLENDVIMARLIHREELFPGIVGEVSEDSEREGSESAFARLRALLWCRRRRIGRVVRRNGGASLLYERWKTNTSQTSPSVEYRS